MKKAAITRDWLVWEEIKSPRPKQAGKKRLAVVLNSRIFQISLILMIFGALMVGSASSSIAEDRFGNYAHYLQRQAIYIFAGIFIGAILIRVPVAVWEKNGPGMFLLAIFLLVLTLIIGEQVNYSTRWIKIMGINIQPSEFAKLAVIIYLSGYLVRHKTVVRQDFLAFLRPVLLIAAVGGLILVEPDLSGMLILVMVSLLMMFMGGVKFYQYIALMLGVIITVILALNLGPEYRLERVMSMYEDIWSEPYGKNYQIAQSLIALGNGKLTGLGFGSGVQKLFYLPEAHTDFIFAVITEELGIIGAFVLLAGLGLLVYKIIKVARKAAQCGQEFAVFYTYGLASLISLQVFINVGANMRLLPITGITLPFISYGGSSLLILIAAITIMLRIEYELCHMPGSARKQRRPA